MNSPANWIQNKTVRAVATAVIVAMLAVGLWQLFSATPRLRAISPQRIANVMGTWAELTVVVQDGQDSLAEYALHQAKERLYHVEKTMSAHGVSEIGQLNAAKAGQFVPLSPEVLDLLKLSQQYTRQTGGAFDVTCRPVLRCWAKAAARDRTPTKEELDRALAASGWRNVDLLPGGAKKRLAESGIDLGGIAKKYAIDQAVEAMIQAGCSGGRVNVGGDIRVFGKNGDGSTNWLVNIRDPFAPRSEVWLAQISVSNSAVCTSGDYERFFRAKGKRRSHIVDARDGMPVDRYPSVTVISPKAIDGVWATALSVLGPDGMPMIRKAACQAEALVVDGSAQSYRIWIAAGFEKYLTQPVPTGTLTAATTSAPAQQPHTDTAGATSSHATPHEDWSEATPKSKTADPASGSASQSSAEHR